jgi:hypothetical protein
MCSVCYVLLSVDLWSTFMCSVCYVLYSVDFVEHTYVFCVLCSV